MSTRFKRVFVVAIAALVVLAGGAGFRAPAHAAEFSGWSLATDAENVIITLSGTRSVNNTYVNARFGVTGGEDERSQIVMDTNHRDVLNSYWGAINGAVYDCTETQHGDQVNFTYRIKVPKTYFNGDTAELSLNGVKKSVALSDGTSGSTGAENAGESENTESGDGNGESGNNGDGGNTDNTGDGGENEGAGGALTPNTQGKIVVDGDASDWAKVPAQATNNEKIEKWKVTRDAAGNVYLMVKSTSSTQWDDNPLQNDPKLTITANGQTKEESLDEHNWELKNVFGATIAFKNQASHNSPGPYCYEMMIPADKLGDDFSFTLAGTTVKGTDMPVVNGTPVSESTNDKYEGIVIDGQYADWDPVEKHDGNDPGKMLNEVAAVWDGDYLYLYIDEVYGSNGAWNAGSHSNGKYSIVTDNGHELLFNLNPDGTITGPDGATCRRVGTQWEIAIPSSEIPPYSKTINFGLYQTDPMITDIANLDGRTGGTFEEIVYDGQYGDWTYYPHQLIEYKTSGTHSNKVDAKGALYSSGDKLYGHVYTENEDHLNQDKGNEFSTGVTIDLSNHNFNPRLITVDSNGNIDWNPPMRDLPSGDYTYYIVDRSGWSSAKTIEELQSQAPANQNIYGEMTITVSEGRDECEFYLDYETLAQKFGCDASEFQEIKAQFINIGDDWIGPEAGASSGPVVGILLCLGVVGAVWMRRKMLAKNGSVAA